MHLFHYKLVLNYAQNISMLMNNKALVCQIVQLHLLYLESLMTGNVLKCVLWLTVNSQTILLTLAWQHVHLIIILTIELVSARLIVVTGMPMMQKYPKHAQLYVNQDLMLIKQHINVLENAQITITLMNLTENAFSFAHQDGLLKTPTTNVLKNVLQLILTLID